jgi:hypothetical protein
MSRALTRPGFCDVDDFAVGEDIDGKAEPAAFSNCLSDSGTKREHDSPFEGKFEDVFGETAHGVFLN